MKTLLETPAAPEENEDQVLSVRVPPEMFAAVRSAAQQEYTGLSTIVRKALAKYLGIRE
jgi:predicted HicB family RNase H-like nuclease